MYIIQATPNSSGSYPPIMTWNSENIPEGWLEFPQEFYNIFYNSEKEYKGFVNIEKEGNKVVNVTWNEEAYQTYLSTQPDPIIEAKNKKIEDIAKICNQTIDNGAEVELSDGSKENFTYSLADQANISEMFTAIMAGATEYPYHENDGGCKMYSSENIVRIYSTLSGIKTATITYHNQLKQYIKSLTDLGEVNSVQWGQPLTGEWLDTYNTLIQQATEQMNIVLAKVASLNN